MSEVPNGVCKRPLCEPAQKIVNSLKFEIEELKKQNQELRKFIERIG